jgi:hypothetical protein
MRIWLVMTPFETQLTPHQVERARNTKSLMSRAGLWVVLGYPLYIAISVTTLSINNNIKSYLSMQAIALIRPLGPSFANYIAHMLKTGQINFAFQLSSALAASLFCCSIIIAISLKCVWTLGIEFYILRGQEQRKSLITSLWKDVAVLTALLSLSLLLGYLFAFLIAYDSAARISSAKLMITLFYFPVIYQIVCIGLLLSAMQLKKIILRLSYLQRI